MPIEIEAGEDVLARDVVTVERLAEIAALPVPRRMLMVAATIAEGQGHTGGPLGGLAFSLRVLAGVYDRAAGARPAGSSLRRELTENANECRRLVFQVDLVEALAEGHSGDVHAAAVELAESHAENAASGLHPPTTRALMLDAERRARAIAEHLAALQPSEADAERITRGAAWPASRQAGVTDGR